MSDNMCNCFNSNVELGDKQHECSYCGFCKNYVSCIYKGSEIWCSVINCKCTVAPCKHYECVFLPLETVEKKCYNNIEGPGDKPSPNQRRR